MAHSPETRKAVWAAYVYQGLDLAVAAAQHSVSTSTAQRWRAEALRAGDDWDRARAASIIGAEAREAMALRLLDEHIALHWEAIGALKTAVDLSPLARVDAITKLTDAFHKNVAAQAKLNPKLAGLAIAADVLRKLGDFVFEKYPQHAEAFAEILEPFGVELSRAYG